MYGGARRFAARAARVPKRRLADHSQPADTTDLVQLRRLILLLLLLPGFVLGPGWNLHVCLQRALNTTIYCSVDPKADCCATADCESHDSGVEVRDGCDACCLKIEASIERLAPSPVDFAGQLERSHVAAFAVVMPAVDLLAVSCGPERATFAIERPPPPSFGRCTPLPLRI